MAGISPRLPLRRDPVDGFSLNKTIPEAVHQNLKNLFLTAPGERIMLPDFGVGIRNYLFEQNVPEVHEAIERRAVQQVSRYMPFVILKSIDFMENESTGALFERTGRANVINNNISYSMDVHAHKLNVAVTYSIEGVNILNVLELSVNLA